MKLIITEKPSVALDIAKVMGIKTKKNGFYIGNGYIITWCAGHLLTLAEPNDYDKRFKSWNISHLPIVPNKFKYKVSDGKSDRVLVIKNLLAREDVTEIINACDAGREGELIFGEIYNNTKNKKPVKRLWISSLEASAIKKGFEDLKDGKEYENLYEAAFCRQKADWMVGINGTRLFTKLYGGELLNVGRVVTPTLALIVDRQKAIDDFIKEPIYSIEMIDGDLKAFYEDRKMKDKNKALEILKACEGNLATVTNVKKTKKFENAPKLFDLTTLQRLANKMFKYTADKTLAIAQSLYEKKLITYPRTDSRFLTSDMEKNALDLLEILSIENINIKQVINNKKVSDHHAIIPTKNGLKDILKISTDERNILEVIKTRFASAVSPRFEYQETVIIFDCNSNKFLATGKAIIKLGFKEIEPDNTKEIFLPNLNKGDILENPQFELKEGETTPPKPYTENTLLATMENVNKADFDSDVERKGIGTPATRASIIEKLVRSSFIKREKNNLLPTPKGVHTILILPDSIKSPLLTAEWENALKKVERGESTPEQFMESIKSFVFDIVKKEREGLTKMD
ncbi:MAG: DNA topoisomerase 3 [Defluviitaleaceae bacterium]|nr:DNA topoisomerase 3 [Defluviitaleaceae bacterium]